MKFTDLSKNAKNLKKQTRRSKVITKNYEFVKNTKKSKETNETK